MEYESSNYLGGTTNFARYLLSLRKIIFLVKYKNCLSAQNVENWMGEKRNLVRSLIYSIVKKGIKKTPIKSMERLLVWVENGFYNLGITFNTRYISYDVLFMRKLGELSTNHIFIYSRFLFR